MKTNQKIEKSSQKTKGFLWLLNIAVGVAFCLLFTLQKAQAQQVEYTTNEGYINAIASYDTPLRNSILVASQHADIFTKMQLLKDQSQNSFHALINNLSQKKQAWFYELTRYPDLLQTLAQKPLGLKKAEILTLIPSSDKLLQDACWGLYKSNNNDLKKVAKINQSADVQFAALVQPFDETTRMAFEELIAHPDVLALLTTNMNKTIELGNAFFANNLKVSNDLSQKHDTLLAENEQEVAYYKKSIDDDPNAKAQLEQAARDYAKQYGYILPNNVGFAGNYYANPYSYWFGYPYWYGSALWYPNAFWGSFGLNYGLGGFGLYGFPTFGFSNWFYGSGYYWNYPILYRQMGNYYRNSLTNHRRIVPSNQGFISSARSHYSNPSAGHAVYPRSSSTPTQGTFNRRNYNSSNQSGNSRNSFNGTMRGNTNNSFRGSAGSSGFSRGSSGGSFGAARGGGGRH